jgi:hypothetical protein
MNHQPTKDQIQQHMAEDQITASRDPRPVFFGDPAKDAQWDLIMALTNELGATRARLDALERVLTEQQTIKQGAVDHWVPDEEAATERTFDMQAYIKRVFNTLTLGR